MLRFVLNAMTLLSVLVFILAAAFWVRGQFAGDSIARQTATTDWSIRGSRSGVAFLGILSDGTRGTLGINKSLAPGEVEWTNDGWGPVDHETWSALGEDLSADSAPAQVDYFHIVFLKHPLRTIFGTGTVIVIHIPYWLLLFLSAILPAAWFLRRRNLPHRRRRLGLCVHCGYDVRGALARCPECGLPSGYAVSAS